MEISDRCGKLTVQRLESGLLDICLNVVSTLTLVDAGSISGVNINVKTHRGEALLSFLWVLFQ